MFYHTGHVRLFVNIWNTGKKYWRAENFPSFTPLLPAIDLFCPLIVNNSPAIMDGTKHCLNEHTHTGMGVGTEDLYQYVQYVHV